jgi:hypothetical protein
LIERRHMTRYDFGAIAEIIDLRSREDVIAITRDLSLAGCFVKTRAPFSPGTEVRVRITSGGRDFKAIGYVTGNLSLEGMGIEFVEIEPSDQAVIEAWLNVKALTAVDHEDAGEILPGQVRLKNRLIREQRNVRVTAIDRKPLDRKPEADRPGLFAKGLLESARNFWKSRDEARH